MFLQIDDGSMIFCFPSYAEISSLPKQIQSQIERVPITEMRSFEFDIHKVLLFMDASQFCPLHDCSATP